MSMTIQSSVKDKILVAQSKVSKVENATTEMLRGRDQQMEKKDDGGLYFIDRGWDSIDRHGVSVSIISDRDGRFTSRFWQTLQKALRTRLDMCTAYHPQRMDKSVRCAPFEALYGRKYRSPVLWAEVGENRLIGPEMVQETIDKVVLIKERLKAARDRQKSYADNRRKPLEFEVGDQMLLKVSLWKGVIRFRKKGKLEQRSVWRMQICMCLDEIKIDKTFRFVEEPVEIMDREGKSLKRSKISIVKVRWNSKRGPESTWEREDHMKAKYPRLFADCAVEPTS
ncbi:putative reverse transcriptase domain-containing protein [Tanacetum coccineum]